ncbi:MAG: type II toxin-antitoxin system RelE/ParE family toxin [bacterium]|nr:type II toxin-antitoxin system RelE/ParE family toxin [bacterium]
MSINGYRKGNYKVRARNRDARKGKSGGYRVVYYVRSQEACILLTVFSKSDQADIPRNRIQQIIEEYETTNRSTDDN